MSPWVKEFLEHVYITDDGYIDWWQAMQFSNRFGGLNSTVYLHIVRVFQYDP